MNLIVAVIISSDDHMTMTYNTQIPNFDLNSAMYDLENSLMANWQVSSYIFTLIRPFDFFGTFKHCLVSALTNTWNFDVNSFDPYYRHPMGCV